MYVVAASLIGARLARPSSSSLPDVSSEVAPAAFPGLPVPSASTVLPRCNVPALLVSIQLIECRAVAVP